MKAVNEKKVKSIVTNSTKQLLNNNAKLLKQEFNLEVPKNILNMESEDFYVFVIDVAYPIMKDVKSNNTEINHIIRNLQAYVNQFDNTIIPWSGLTNNFSN